jgi:hypothetical protein
MMPWLRPSTTLTQAGSMSKTMLKKKRSLICSCHYLQECVSCPLHSLLGISLYICTPPLAGDWIQWFRLKVKSFFLVSRLADNVTVMSFFFFYLNKCISEWYLDYGPSAPVT